MTFFAVGSALLGATYAMTGSEDLQVAVLFALVFVVLPALSRRFGVQDAYMQVLEERKAPIGVLVLSLVFLIGWGALVFVAVPDFRLGPWFSLWVLMWPWLEVFSLLAEARLDREGADNWKPVRPLRDCGAAGLATAPLITMLMLLNDTPLGDAAATGLACGVIVFVIAGTFAWLERRARPIS